MKPGRPWLIVRLCALDLRTAHQRRWEFRGNQGKDPRQAGTRDRSEVVSEPEPITGARTDGRGRLHAAVSGSCSPSPPRPRDRCGAIRRTASDVVRRAFPDKARGLGVARDCRATGRARGEGARCVDPAVRKNVKRLLELGASALETLRTEGPAAALSAEAQLGDEAIVSVARPALMMQDGEFGTPPRLGRHP